MDVTKSFQISRHAVKEAFEHVKANKGAAGVDSKSLEEFERKLEDNLYKIWNRMSSGSYFPPPVKRVTIPKKDGGRRHLGVPTVGDRIAQQVVRMYLEPKLEPHFHPDSYGYRPMKSAIEAVGRARERCWRYDWIIDLDIKGFFDNIDHGLMMRAVRRYTDCRWMLLYIERWLKAPVQLEDGALQQREKGTPQGGVISPLLANLFLHLSFDEWMSREHPQAPFERYADDIVVHCATEWQAKLILESIRFRLGRCKLELHPDKTRIVYCGRGRPGQPTGNFDFLGYCFRPRRAKSKHGHVFNGFLPAISKASIKEIRDEIRGWKLHLRSDLSLEEIARKINPKIRGWINYYGAFYVSAMTPVFLSLNRVLCKWAGRKYKKLRSRLTRTGRWLRAIAKRDPKLFAHWSMLGQIWTAG